MRFHLAVVLVLAGGGPLAAQSTRPRISLGYAYATYLEDGGGSAPFGAYLSVATASKNGVELEAAYHRDPETLFGRKFVLNTITAAVGPHAFLSSGSTRPYGHLLFALRHDSFAGAGNTSYGAMAGFGVDIPLSPGVAVRAGTDFQLFLDNGDTLKALRFLAGFTF
jgi:hypothetical protein